MRLWSRDYRLVPYLQGRRRYYVLLWRGNGCYQSNHQKRDHEFHIFFERSGLYLLWRRRLGVFCEGGVIPPTWQIQPCWTEPLRAARAVPIGESIFPFVASR